MKADAGQKKEYGTEMGMQQPSRGKLQDCFLKQLYGHKAGRMLVQILIQPWVSKLGGILLSSRVSALAVGPFAKYCGIDLSICRSQKFTSFNDFFTRELKEEARPIERDEHAWIAPCDGRLTVWPITEHGRFTIKNTEYTLGQLLRNEALAKRYEGGLLWMYRLCVDDYHRYCYPDDAAKSENIRIPGVFHTVNPAANEVYPIYKENTREYCVMKTRSFGTILMMEVGALLVGKIENRQESGAVRRGQEKGNFAFGGSTIVVLTQKDCVDPEVCYLEHTKCAVETSVRMGQCVGYAKNEVNSNKV